MSTRRQSTAWGGSPWGHYNRPRQSALTPARTLRDHRQARLTQRRLARAEEGGGPEKILERRPELMERLWAGAGLLAGEAVERQT